MNTLYIIPARAGSKGIVKKNTRLLAGKPLIIHSLLIARQFVNDEDICITTDDPDVIILAAQENYKIPFTRPAHLSTDNASMRDVMLHALEHYTSHDKSYDNVVLLQPTSPFRQVADIRNALSLYDSSIDMVVSVVESKANPYFVLFEENNEGFLIKSKTGDFTSRQEAPKVWQLNGAVYVINTDSLKSSSIADFKRIRKIEMDQLHSVDLDTEIDWKLAVLLNEEFQIL